jgi:hypothetical protein
MSTSIVGLLLPPPPQQLHNIDVKIKRFSKTNKRAPNLIHFPPKPFIYFALKSTNRNREESKAGSGLNNAITLMQMFNDHLILFS